MDYLSSHAFWEERKPEEEWNHILTKKSPGHVSPPPSAKACYVKDWLHLPKRISTANEVVSVHVTSCLSKFAQAFLGILPFLNWL